MIINGHNHCHLPSQKMRKCQDYIQALELERTKIQVFQRELPLCLELVTQAIETCKQQMSSGTTSLNQSECSEQTSSDVPVYEEFMPIKRDSCHSDEDDEDNDDEQQKSNKKHKNDNNTIVDTSDKTCKKSDWLRSVQLWNQTPDPPTKLQNSPRKVAVTEVKRNGIGGAFHPFKKLCDTTPTSNCAVPPPPPAPPVAPVSTSSTAETGGSSGNNNINNNNNNNNNNKDQGKDGSSHRKSRRCWSPELHRRFLQALQQLGGSHVATPKQIRELMKVDGLTNDEVKSHLQKYRLHTRRPTTSMHNTTNNNSVQTPQFVVVGGIWVPPEYANMATATTASKEMSGVAQSNNGIYAPIAALPPPFHGASASPKQRQQHKSSNSDERGSHSEGHVRCHSPETSSSTHTTTASPVY